MRTIQREIVGAFIFSADNKILLGKSGVFSESWSVPGGGIEVGESMRTAIDREILEETSIDLSEADVNLLDGINSAASEKILRDTKEKVYVEMNFHDYIVKLEQIAENIAVVAADDFTGAEWHDVSILCSLDLAPGTNKRLAQLGFIKK